METKLSDSRLEEILAQCSQASHGGKTLGQTVTVPASQVESLVKEVKRLRQKASKKGGEK